MSAAFNWKQCFDQIAPNLVLYARQLTPSAADAEDVVQMAFVRWWRRFPDGDTENVPLLYAAVRTIALDLRRSDTRRAKRELASEITKRRPSSRQRSPNCLRSRGKWWCSSSGAG